MQMNSDLPIPVQSTTASKFSDEIGLRNDAVRDLKADLPGLVESVTIAGQRLGTIAKNLREVHSSLNAHTEGDQLPNAAVVELLLAFRESQEVLNRVTFAIEQIETCSREIAGGAALLNKPASTPPQPASA